jgi:hypothetical protein
MNGIGRDPSHKARKPSYSKRRKGAIGDASHFVNFRSCFFKARLNSRALWYYHRMLVCRSADKIAEPTARAAHV